MLGHSYFSGAQCAPISPPIQGASAVFFQHIQAHQPYSGQLHAEEGCSHAVQTISNCTANTLRLFSEKCAGSSAIDSVLLEWQHMQYHTAQVQGS